MIHGSENVLFGSAFSGTPPPPLPKGKVMHGRVVDGKIIPLQPEHREEVKLARTNTPGRKAEFVMVEQGLKIKVTLKDNPRKPTRTVFVNVKERTGTDG